MKRFACLVFVALFLLPACGQAVSAGETTAGTNPSKGASYADALQAKYAGWQEGYYTVLSALWEEHKRNQTEDDTQQRTADNYNFVCELIDYNEDGIPEMIVLLDTDLGWGWIKRYFFSFDGSRVRDMSEYDIVPSTCVNRKTGEVKLFSYTAEVDYGVYEVSLDFEAYRMEIYHLPETTCETWLKDWEPIERLKEYEFYCDTHNDAWSHGELTAEKFNGTADAFEQGS